MKLIDRDWITYKEHRNLTPRGSPSFILAITAAERFYIAAEARNEALANNMTDHLKRRNGQDAVMPHCNKSEFEETGRIVKLTEG